MAAWVIAVSGGGSGRGGVDQECFFARIVGDKRA